MTFIPFPKKKRKKDCNICVLYLGLFIHVPGEGDGVVGDFFDVADCVEALLVISCEDKQRDFLFLQSHQPFKYNFCCKCMLKRCPRMSIFSICITKSYLNFCNFWLISAVFRNLTKHHISSLYTAKIGQSMTQAGSYCLLR